MNHLLPNICTITLDGTNLIITHNVGLPNTAGLMTCCNDHKSQVTNHKVHTHPQMAHPPSLYDTYAICQAQNYSTNPCQYALKLSNDSL